MHSVNSITAVEIFYEVNRKKKKHLHMPYTPKKRPTEYSHSAIMNAVCAVLLKYLTSVNKYKSTSFTLAKWEGAVIFVITMRLVNYCNSVDLWHIRVTSV